MLTRWGQAVHNPIHYFELPELFMELTSSMTGPPPAAHPTAQSAPARVGASVSLWFACRTGASA
jgi:hypothetical protein